MSATTAGNTQLIDRFGRHVTYVRISITDRCDFRCVYCMAEDMAFLPRQQILTLEEISELAATFVSLGVTKIRITGGEPLVRNGVVGLFEQLGRLRDQGLKDLTLTTNGSQLTRYAKDLAAAGVRRINISLDSLKADRFARITRRGELDKVLAGIDAARDAGIERIKINSVILKGRNEDEILDLVEFVRERGMDISFIEEMPLGVIGDHDRAEVFYSSDQVRADIEQRYALYPTTETTGGPSRYYRMESGETRVGFISPHSHNFCESCNRVRVTVEGRLLLCLGQEHSMDLKQVMRAHPGDRQRLQQAIIDSMQIKPKGHDFDLSRKPVIMRHMSVTGG
ncbi:cyclic pyranopterin monophosphate synthase subunit MoaA [Ectothiorhodosinus mongolicus]|uniref:GTP 3',8-cyclase n=1 Tax=Ectothiorhodosinus mongolicus TaxID=233100 RepID=A0A1R3VM53_9GAMM|nr:GTP 3',8-cyclase MoaA [Ectothiorhodosinus mongolicus]ULX57803.1 GTP 3',8-cyclase MoaA [Ectothiorhodosinus mongolicus]SIT65668.1 cyclic pyranopterin monophosphate synthase subunit MoaA [Ectothiorhodosinus mongolicus]